MCAPGIMRNDPFHKALMKVSPLDRATNKLVMKFDPVQQYLQKDPYEAQRKQVAAQNAYQKSLLETN